MFGIKKSDSSYKIFANKQTSPLEVNLDQLQQEINQKEQQNQSEVPHLDVASQNLIQLPFSIQQYQEIQKTSFLYNLMGQTIRHNNFIKEFVIGKLSAKFDKNQIESQNQKTQEEDETFNIDKDIFNDSFSDHEEEKRYLQNNSKISKIEELLTIKFEEALTSPQVDKHINYERLEFLGDTVLNFLSLLELCTTMPNLKNKELDLLKIERVNNKNLAIAAEQASLSKYIVAQQQKGNVIPEFINSEEYENNITRKNIQQIASKLVYLNKLKQELIQQSQQNNKVLEIVTDEYIIMMKCIQDRNDLYSYLIDYLNQNFVGKENLIKLIKRTYPSQHNAQVLFKEFGISQNDLELIFMNYNINKLQNKFNNLVSKKTQKKQESKETLNQLSHQQYLDNQNQQTIFQASYSQPQNPKLIKQLADTVEALTGAMSLKDIQYASIFLQSLGIMKHTFNELQEQKKKLLQIQTNYEYHQQFLRFFNEKVFSFVKLEQLLGIYKFKDISQKSQFAIMSLINSSYFETEECAKIFKYDKNVIQKYILEDNERLEFLGDSILNYFVSEYLFNKTEKDKQNYPPKKLHMMKQNVISNVMLTHIVVELGLDILLMYDKNITRQRLPQKKVKSIEECLNAIRKKIQEYPIHKNIERYNQLMTQKQNIERKEDSDIKQQELILNNKHLTELRDDIYSIHEVIYENNYKMFSDMFEAIIGAIYLDCKDLQITKQVLHHLMKDYLTIYTDYNMIVDNPRSATLELWDSKPYTSGIKITHSSFQGSDNTIIAGLVDDLDVLRIKYPNEKKSKLREFYTTMFKLISNFLKVCDKENIQTKEQCYERMKIYRILKQ